MYIIGLNQVRRDGSAYFYGSSFSESDVKEEFWAKIENDNIISKNFNFYDEEDKIKEIIGLIYQSDFKIEDCKFSRINSKQIEIMCNHDNIEEKIIDIIKDGNDKEIDKYFTLYRSPANIRIKNLEHEKELLYIFYLYKQYFDTVKFDTIERPKEGTFLNSLNGNLINIAKIAIKNEIYIEDFRMKYNDISDNNFEKRISFYKELDNILKELNLNIEDFYSIRKCNDFKYDINFITNKLKDFSKSSDEIKLEYYKKLEKEDIENLYNKKNDVLIKYAKNIFNKIKSIQAYYPGELDYYCSYIIEDENLALSIKNDKLLPLFFHNKNGINRGYYFDNDNRWKIEIELAHGPFCYIEQLFLDCTEDKISSKFYQED